MGIPLAAGLLLAAAPTFGTYGDERLAALIGEALENNPRIQQAFAEYQAALQRVPQAAARPDPKLSLTQYARTIETRVGSQPRVLTVSQEFPGFGKRAARSQVASKAAAAIDELYQAERAEIVRQVKKAYFALGYVDRAIELSREDERLLEHFEEVARNRYALGFGLQGDVVRLQAQITQALSRREQLTRQRVDLEALLNSIRDMPTDSPIGKVELPARPEMRLDREMLTAIGRQQRPELKAAFLRIEEHEKGVQLARRRSRPDFTLGLTWGNIRARGFGLLDMPLAHDGKDAYGVTVGMTLPLFRSKYDAGIREASEAFSSARAAYRSAANAMEADLRSITFKMETIERQINLFESALLPQAEQALRSTQVAYSTGTLGVVSLLDVQRTLVDVRLGLARLHADYFDAMADLERAIGSAVPQEDPS